MSKSRVRGGTILIEDGKAKVIRKPTQMAASDKKVTKSTPKTTKKSEKK